MLNRLWAAMIVLGIVWAGLHGTMSDVTGQILDSAQDAVQLCVTMLGVMAMWTGWMKVAQEAGIVAQLTGMLNPFLRWMFPNIPDRHPAKTSISVNLVANLLGLGWAATPAGLQAMRELAKLEEERNGNRSLQSRKTASDEMCTFLVLNISSLQLIPVNIIAYRSQYGSANPAAIVGPCIAATIVSTAAAVLFCKIMTKR